MQVNQNLLIAQVVKFLNEHGYCAWRQENNGRIDESAAASNLLKLFDALQTVNYSKEKKAKLVIDILRKSYRKVPCALLGVADVIGFHLQTGVWVAVECKIGNDVVRPEQKEFMDNLRQAGGSVWLCRDINSFKAGFLRKRQTASTV